MSQKNNNNWVDIQLSDNNNNNSTSDGYFYHNDLNEYIEDVDDGVANNNDVLKYVSELKLLSSLHTSSQSSIHSEQSYNYNSISSASTVTGDNRFQTQSFVSHDENNASSKSNDSQNQFDFDEQIVHPKRGRISSMVEELLSEIYCNLRDGNRYRNCSVSSSDASSYSTPELQRKPPLRKAYLQAKAIPELNELYNQLKSDVDRMNAILVHHLRRRDKISSQRSQYFDIITASLQAISPKRSVDTKMRFSIEPYPGDSGFNQWHDAMRMVSRLPGGIPMEFRKKLWITLAEFHIQTRKINWTITSRFCFNDKNNPDDEELGVQIVKDLHRTGCSLFSGEDAIHNQALLKQVLLAYARWNKSVGYCQGFNMLAAIILEVMEGNVENSLKVMIYLIEGVLPESYFANNLRGLSVDMAVFRDLLRMRLPTLAKHLDKLQYEAQDMNTGACYEPPLINVFTMQWFLTLFSNCLPKVSVLRIWDLIFLEGNEVLLRTALAIWDCLADRIMPVESADEFYSIMGVLTREMMEFGLTDTNGLIKTICIMAPFPFPQLSELREKYMYNIRPLTTSFALVKKGLQLFQSDDEDEPDNDESLVVATWFLTSSLNKNKDGTGSRTPSPSSTPTTQFGINFGTPTGSPSNTSTANTNGNNNNNRNNFLSANNIDPQRLSLDVTLLKKQYSKLKERQKQARIILKEGFQNAHDNAFTKRKDPFAVNHLLVGKTALTTKRPKRPNPVIQAPTRANFDQKSSGKTLPGRSKTFTNLFAHHKTSKPIIESMNNKNNHNRNQLANIVMTPPSPTLGSTSETISWSQIKLEKKRRMLRRKMSEPLLSSFQEVSFEEINSNSNSIDKKEMDNEKDKVMFINDAISYHHVNNLTNDDNNNDKDEINIEYDSCSSSSTELCDEDHLYDNISISDHNSSPELSIGKNGNNDSSVKQTGNINENVNSININDNNLNHDQQSYGKVGSDRGIVNEDEIEKEFVDQNYTEVNVIKHDVEQNEAEDYSSIKREISHLSLDDCIKRLNEKMSELAEFGND